MSLVNKANLSGRAFLETEGVDVTLENVRLGLKVRRGRHWNVKKWRDDVDKSAESNPKPRVQGQIIGFTDNQGVLRGENSGRKYATDRVTDVNEPGWAVVRWATGAASTYPIGAEGLYSLILTD